LVSVEGNTIHAASHFYAGVTFLKFHLPATLAKLEVAHMPIISLFVPVTLDVILLCLAEAPGDNEVV